MDASERLRVFIAYVSAEVYEIITEDCTAYDEDITRLNKA